MTACLAPTSHAGLQTHPVPLLSTLVPPASLGRGFAGLLELGDDWLPLSPREVAAGKVRADADNTSRHSKRSLQHSVDHSVLEITSSQRWAISWNRSLPPTMSEGERRIRRNDAHGSL